MSNKTKVWPYEKAALVKATMRDQTMVPTSNKGKIMAYPFYQNKGGIYFQGPCGDEFGPYPDLETAKVEIKRTRRK